MCCEEVNIETHGSGPPHWENLLWYFEVDQTIYFSLLLDKYRCYFILESVDIKKALSPLMQSKYKVKRFVKNERTFTKSEQIGNNKNFVMTPRHHKVNNSAKLYSPMYRGLSNGKPYASQLQAGSLNRFTNY